MVILLFSILFLLQNLHIISFLLKSKYYNIYYKKYSEVNVVIHHQMKHIKKHLFYLVFQEVFAVLQNISLNFRLICFKLSCFLNYFFKFKPCMSKTISNLLNRNSIRLALLMINEIMFKWWFGSCKTQLFLFYKSF